MRLRTLDIILCMAKKMVIGAVLQKKGESGKQAPLSVSMDQLPENPTALSTGSRAEADGKAPLVIRGTARLMLF